jgi:hypothetical protein
MGKMNSPEFLFMAAVEFFENGTLYAGKYFMMKDNVAKVAFDSTTHAKLVVPASYISFGLELALKGCLKFHGISKKRRRFKGAV